LITVCWTWFNGLKPCMLPTRCIYMFRIESITAVISLNNINLFLFWRRRDVSYKVRTECYVIWIHLSSFLSRLVPLMGVLLGLRCFWCTEIAFQLDKTLILVLLANDGTAFLASDCYSRFVMQKP
jgi:hypothetical protein